MHVRSAIWPSALARHTRKLLRKWRSEPPGATLQRACTPPEIPVDLMPLLEGTCPDCQSELFHPGPRTAETIAVKCVACGAQFAYSKRFIPRRVENADCLYILAARKLLADL